MKFRAVSYNICQCFQNRESGGNTGSTSHCHDQPDSQPDSQGDPGPSRDASDSSDYAQQQENDQVWTKFYVCRFSLYNFWFVFIVNLSLLFLCFRYRVIRIIVWILMKNSTPDNNIKENPAVETPRGLPSAIVNIPTLANTIFKESPLSLLNLMLLIRYIRSFKALNSEFKFFSESCLILFLFCSNTMWYNISSLLPSLAVSF